MPGKINKQEVVARRLGGDRSEGAPDVFFRWLLGGVGVVTGECDHLNAFLPAERFGAEADSPRKRFRVVFRITEIEVPRKREGSGPNENAVKSPGAASGKRRF